MLASLTPRTTIYPTPTRLPGAAQPQPVIMLVRPAGGGPPQPVCSLPLSSSESDTIFATVSGLSESLVVFASLTELHTRPCPPTPGGRPSSCVVQLSARSPSGTRPEPRAAGYGRGRSYRCLAVRAAGTARAAPCHHPRLRRAYRRYSACAVGRCAARWSAA